MTSISVYIIISHTTGITDQCRLYVILTTYTNNADLNAHNILPRSLTNLIVKLACNQFPT